MPGLRAAGGALAHTRVGCGRFVTRATRERGVGVPSSRGLAKASREALSFYRSTHSVFLTQIEGTSGSSECPRTPSGPVEPRNPFGRHRGKH